MPRISMQLFVLHTPLIFGFSQYAFPSGHTCGQRQSRRQPRYARRFKAPPIAHHSHGQESFTLCTMSNDEDRNDVMAKILVVRAPERAPQ
ncbi:hypothetical protein C8J57DRAFT_1276731 [Mycena rebaudengoi]|nr:hypothetical protein C8J57DRAFT_1276731 [Mycena rebaudengoi]